MPTSRFALHGKRPSLIHGLCAISASNSRFMRLLRPHLTPVSAAPFWPASQFTVCTSRFTQLRNALCTKMFQRFRKGDGGQRGLKKRRSSLWPMPEVQTSFLHSLSYPPLGEGRHDSGNFFFWRRFGLC